MRHSLWKGRYLRPAFAVVTAVAAGLIAPLVSATPSMAVESDPAGDVDPFIGSAGSGNTYPGAGLPFGMIAWSPTTHVKGDGYDPTKPLRGFSLTHLNGAGCDPGPGGDIPILPYAGEVNSAPGSADDDDKYVTAFAAGTGNDETNAGEGQTATPGHFRARLTSGVGADLAVTQRAGIADFTYPTDKEGPADGPPASLLFRVSNSLNGSSDAHIDIDKTDRNTVTGWVDGGGFCGHRLNGGNPNPNRRSYYRLYFTAAFDRPFTSWGTWKDGVRTPGSSSADGGETFEKNRSGKGSGGYVTFDKGTDHVGMRVGISYVSLAGAKNNLQREIPQASDQKTTTVLEDVEEKGRKRWNDVLSGIKIGGTEDKDRLKIFHTALYHALQQPNVISDVDGRYPGISPDPENPAAPEYTSQKVKAGQEAQYSNFSGWDQYRAQVQLLALLQPKVAGDFAQSLYNFAKQNKQRTQDPDVWDRWIHINGPTHVMSGDPSAATLATFYAMGVRNFDYYGAFESLYRQATTPAAEENSTVGCIGQCRSARPNLTDYQKLRYAPGEKCGGGCWGGASETLEESVADTALAAWAQALQRDVKDPAQKKQLATQQNLGPRGGYWKNVFHDKADGKEGYIQPRNADRSWVTSPEDGIFHPEKQTGFAQGSAAQYVWMMPQDPQGLAAKMGGSDKAARRLTAFFHITPGTHGWTYAQNTDGAHYDPSNEPDIHAPWLYNALGKPWQTQETVRAILDSSYNSSHSGLPGNDDLGTMSAWYVFSALGIYPKAPGSGDLLLGAPVFPKAVLHRAGKGDITITSTGASSTNTYVHSANFTTGTKTSPRALPAWLDAGSVNSGGTLHFTFGTDKNWATSTELPPSLFQQVNSSK